MSKTTSKAMPPLPSPTSYMVKALYAWLTDAGHTPYIMIRTDVPNIDIPLNIIREDGSCILNLSMTATHNLSFDEQFITFHARFNGKSQQLFVPYSALLTMFSKEEGHGFVLANVEQMWQSNRNAEKDINGERPMIRAVDSGLAMTEEARGDVERPVPDAAVPVVDVVAEPTPRRKGHLTLVSSN